MSVDCKVGQFRYATLERERAWGKPIKSSATIVVYGFMMDDGMVWYGMVSNIRKGFYQTRIFFIIYFSPDYQIGELTVAFLCCDNGQSS